MFTKLSARSKRIAAVASLLPFSLLACVGVAAGDPGYRQVVTFPTERLTLPASNPAQANSSATSTGSSLSATVGTTTPKAISFTPSAILNMDVKALGSADASSIALVGKLAAAIEIAKTPDGARRMASIIAQSNFGWGRSQFACLSTLWNNESHWNFHARNSYSGALGIAQASPPDKMDIIATDWRNNPITQIKWGLNYIKVRYGSPCKALRLKSWRGYY